MANATASAPRKFSFMLEYMGRAMLLKTCRAESYRVITLCNIASLVLNTPQSPAIHYFRPKVVLAWAGREFDVLSEEVFSKLVNVCMVKGHSNLQVVVLFHSVEVKDGTVERVEVPRMHLTNGEAPDVICDDTFSHGLRLEAGNHTTVLGKRRYKCKNCSVFGHNKRACKLSKPMATVAATSSGVKAVIFGI